MKKPMGKHPKINSDYSLEININNMMVTSKETLTDIEDNEIFVGQSKNESISRNSMPVVTMPGQEPQELSERQKLINEFLDKVELLYAELYLKL